MTRNITFAVMALATALVLVSAPLSQAGNGWVDVHIKSSVPAFYDDALWCHNWLEIWIANDSELVEMSLGFEITYPGYLPLQFYPEHTNQPEKWSYVMEQDGAVGAFDLTDGILVDARFDGVGPDTVLISGSASPGNGLPPSYPPGAAQIRYTLFFTAPPGSPECFPCIGVDNIFVPPTGTWMFEDDTVYAPAFAGNDNASPENPDAPPVLFDFIECPCMLPIWTNLPESPVVLSHCQDYSFDFDAVDGGNTPPAYPLWYLATAGVMDTLTGEFLLPAPTAGGCTTQVVRVFAQDQLCDTRHFDLEVIWLNELPGILGCPVTTGKAPMGELYHYPLTGVDPDPCDGPTFSIAAIGDEPIGTYEVDAEGNVTFTPDLGDDGNTYLFEIQVEDGCDETDNCLMAVLVGQVLCGDCDGSDVVNVSDVVYLIVYVFGGGLPPNPPSLGDVDCNGITNISDAVYLIAYIFGGGPEPCAECP